MDLYILNKEFETIGIIDRYISLIWTERYQEPDDFQMEITVEDFVKIGIRPDYYVYQKKSNNLMVIEKFEFKHEEDDPPIIKVSGRGLECILDRRVIYDSYTIYEESPDELLETLINEFFTNPKDEKRKTDVPKYIPSTQKEVEEMRYNNNVKHTTLLEVVLDVCQSQDIGFRAWFSRGNFCYQFYKGIDFSWAQDYKTWVVYSPKFNNLLSTEFDYDNTTYKNSIVIYGEEASETTNPNTGETIYWEQYTINYTRDKEARGLDLKEGYLDCSDVSRWQGDYLISEGMAPRPPEDVTHGWKKLPLWLYDPVLWREAYKRLYQSDVTMVYNAEADENMQWKLGKNFILGDIVQVVNEFGFESRCRVDSVIFSHNTEGIRYYPTFVAVDNNITQEGGTIVW